MTDQNDNGLDRRLAALPREIDPPRELWPDVRAAIAPRTARVRSTTLLQLAAAALLFVAGWIVGHYGRTPTYRAPSTTGDPLAAAVEIQKAGTAYVAALAELRRSAAAERPDVLAQARDAAIAAVEGAAWELTRMRQDTTAAAIFEIAERDRHAK